MFSADFVCLSSFWELEDGAKQGYSTVTSTVSAFVKKNDVRERKQHRYSGPFVQELA